MKTTLVLNPKGGAGKTTIATNLASCFAAADIPTTLMDYDPQGSSMNWLRLRPAHAARIHRANGAPERRDRLRSFESYVPGDTERLVIDAPAGASGMLLQEMLERAHCLLVPVVPSAIDLHATANFLRELSGWGRVRSGAVPVAVVANKVRRSMPAYWPLEQFLQAANLKLLARLIDSDVYLRAAGRGWASSSSTRISRCRSESSSPRSSNGSRTVARPRWRPTPRYTPSRGAAPPSRCKTSRAAARSARAGSRAASPLRGPRFPAPCGP